MQPLPHRLITCLGALSALLIWLFGMFTNATDLYAQNQPGLIPIYQLQGNGLVSPYQGKWVDTYGLVTGVLSDGFYLQDPGGDDEPATSDGIFVYTYKAPSVGTGDCVLLTRAYVDEFYEKTELSRLKTITPSSTRRPSHRARRRASSRPSSSRG